VLALAGDSHASWATELALDPFSPAYDPVTGDGAIGVELGVPGISSPNLDPAAAPAEEARILAASPHTRYTEQSSRGFLVLDLDRERARAERFFVDGVDGPGPVIARSGPVHEVRAGARRLVR
jgi:alkaline phosphatase D